MIPKTILTKWVDFPAVLCTDCIFTDFTAHLFDLAPGVAGRSFPGVGSLWQRTPFILLRNNPLFQWGYAAKTRNHPVFTLPHIGANLGLYSLGGVATLPWKQNRLQGDFCAKQLLFVVEFQRKLDRQNRKFQIPVASFSGSCVYFRVFRFNKPLAFKGFHILLHGVPAQAHCLADGFEAGIAGKTFPILTAEEIRIDCDFSGGKSQREQTVGEFKVVTVGVQFGVLLYGY